MHARSEIASLNGVDFKWLVEQKKESEALAVVNELIAKNRDEFLWIMEKPECADQISQASEFWASKFYYRHYKGT